QFGNIHSELQFIKQQIQAIQQAPQAPWKVDNEKELKRRLGELLKREELFWRQKVRVTWLHERDRNSRFFYLSTIIRGSRNRIHSIKCENGIVIQTRDGITQAFIQKLGNTFSAEPTSFSVDPEALIQPSIFGSVNEILAKIPSEEEITVVVCSMDPWKVPSPDRFSGLFFRHNWSTVAGNIVNMVHDFFIYDRLLKALNKTNIVLIPKRRAR
ncbi:hypothetical protein PanWU01x14_143150, partial [Parasponia andersonii]